jgi:hypothetical protein
MKYNTDINIIGSIPDYELIYKAIELFSRNSDDLENLIIKDNQFDFRTEKSRKRFLAAVYSAFLDFKSDDHKELLINFFKTNLSMTSKQMILFWQFLSTNQLFHEITRDVFFKAYFSGRVSLPKDDVVAYIKELISQNDDLKGSWSQITIETIASKYLTILKKLDLLEGTNKKSFKHIQLSNGELLIFIYLIKIFEPENPNILNSKFLGFSFISKDSFLNRVKQLAKKDLFEMSFNGEQLKIEINKPYQGIN